MRAARAVCRLRRGHPGVAARAGAPPLDTLVRQRVFQIACGYEDQDDADTLRTDPLLKLVCGRLPETGRDLASQPTLSRLENAVDRKSCYRLAMALGELYLRERERDGMPTHIVLDLDGTDDPTHGQQEGSAYHGYYRQHMYHPLLDLRWRDRTSSSPPCCARAIPTAARASSPCSSGWCGRCARAGRR